MVIGRLPTRAEISGPGESLSLDAVTHLGVRLQGNLMDRVWVLKSSIRVLSSKLGCYKVRSRACYFARR